MLKKKIDNLASQLAKSKLPYDDDQQKIRKYEDTSKYVDIYTFTEFQKSYTKENNNLSMGIDENKRAIDDINIAFKDKINPKELRTTEEYILNKLDEFKILCTKKFSDKIETFKNVKYLDTQVKQI